MLKFFLPLSFLILAIGVWHPAVAGLAVLFFIVGVVAWVVGSRALVQVPELETAVVRRRGSGRFDRFLPAGRHWINPLRQQVTAVIPTSPGTVTGRATDVPTAGGIPLTVDWSLSYRLAPFRIPAAARPRLARALPRQSGQIARRHIDNVLRHVVGQYTIAQLSQPGMLSRLERETRQQTAARLADLGFTITRVMVGAVVLPPAVQQAMAAAYEQRIKLAHEAESLARLHRVISQYSDADVQRLLELERILKLGENGVALQYQAAISPTPPPPPKRRPTGAHSRIRPPEALFGGLS